MADPSSLEHRPLIRALHVVDVLLARVYHDTTVLAPCRLPATEPAILVCNHTSGLDPLLIQSVTRRLIVWMMAREYYEIKSLQWGLKLIRAIPVERSGRDMAATRAALRALHDGYVLGVFPEGRIETTRQLLPFQVGVAMMAIKAAVPVYPAYLDGTQRGKEMARAFVERQRATLRFGPPVELGTRSTSHGSLELATARIQQAVEALRTA